MTFMRRTQQDHNKKQLQGLNSAVCGHYCCLFTLYKDRGYTPQKFVGLFDVANADLQISQ
jgi:hypothetical protein